MRRARNGRRVLVTCRDADMRQICEDCLRHVGYDVVTVDEPERALAMVERVRPHLVITSFPAATSAGESVTARLRAEPAFHALPILSLAGWLHPEDLESARSAGVTESLPIPVRLHTLVGAVRRLIGPDADARPRTDAGAGSRRGDRGGAT